MRLTRLMILMFPVTFVAACGGKTPVTTLSVSCEGRNVLAGAKSVDVLADATGGHTTLSFPDPANKDQTGTIPVARGSRCSITEETD